MWSSSTRRIQDICRYACRVSWPRKKEEISRNERELGSCERATDSLTKAFLSLASFREYQKRSKTSSSESSLFPSHILEIQTATKSIEMMFSFVGNRELIASEAVDAIQWLQMHSIRSHTCKLYMIMNIMIALLLEYNKRIKIQRSWVNIYLQHSIIRLCNSFTILQYPFHSQLNTNISSSSSLLLNNNNV